MSRIRILVAEDEPAQRQELVSMLARTWPRAKLVAECSNGLEALDALETSAPHVVFLDIRMPGLSGLELASFVSGRAHVVFVTAYEKYAVRAFETNAVDYLLKPVGTKRLAETVVRLQQRLNATAPPEIDTQLRRILRDLGEQADDRISWITASCGDQVKMFGVDEIVFFQAQNKYVRVVTKNDEAVIRTPLKELAERLDPVAFWQVHRSVIVAASAVECLEKDALGRFRIVVRGFDDRLPVSNAFRHRFKGM